MLIGKGKGRVRDCVRRLPSNNRDGSKRDLIRESQRGCRRDEGGGQGYIKGGSERDCSKRERAERGVSEELSYIIEKLLREGDSVV